MSPRVYLILSLLLVTFCPYAFGEQRGFRGEIVHFLDSPSNPQAMEHIPDGILLLEHGLVKEVGPAEELRSRHPSVPVTDFRGRLIMPGFKMRGRIWSPKHCLSAIPPV